MDHEHEVLVDKEVLSRISGVVYKGEADLENPVSTTNLKIIGYNLVVYCGCMIEVVVYLN
jgi:hypothetical protein